MKNVKKWLALALAFVMILSLAACSSSESSSESSDTEAEEETKEDAEEPEAEEEADASEEENEVTGDPSAEDAFVIWGWNTDFNALQELLEEEYPEMAGRIVFVNCGGSGTYQDKIDSILADPTNELYPDLMLLEVGYVQKYVQSDSLLSLEELGITAEDTANQFAYNIALGSDADGVQKASFWQATPGSLQVRSDLAETYLGTTDSDEISAMLTSWDDVIKLSEQVKEQSDGKVKLFSGYDDLKYIFLNGERKVGWYDSDDVIQVDDSMTEYMEIAKTMYDEELTFNAEQWGTDWYSLMDGDGEETEAAIIYCGCPWFTYWSLSDSWSGKTILADGPCDFYWGGTGLAATTGCADTDMAATIIKACTCDADFMTKIYQANGDYVNNTAAIDTIIKDDIPSTSGFELYGDQSVAEFYSTRGQNIDASIVTAEDQVICESLFPAAVTAYATGVSDLETAVADFKAAVHDTYSYLKVE